MKCINSFDLRGCIRVVELAEDIGCLEGLKELNIQGTGIARLPDSICKLKHLKSFKIKSCWLLEKLPEDIGRLESLEKLILRDVSFYMIVQTSICLRLNCIKKLSSAVVFESLNCRRDIGMLRRRSHEPEAISNQRTTVSRVNSDQVVQEAIATRLRR
ncbi:Toll/interleukin-1 receptor domain-containing protein [Tanacetum coccineum]